MTSERKGIEFERVLGVVAEGLAPWPEPVAVSGIVVYGFDRLAVPVIAEHDELGLHPRIERVTGIGRLLHDPLQRQARTDVVGRILVEQVGEDDGDLPIPRTDENRVEVGDRDLVWIGRSEFGEQRHGMHRELRPLANAQSLELGNRNRLCLGTAQDIDPAREDVFHAGLFQIGLRLIDA